ncbi:MAG: COX15/CtaA family protein [Microthrixaceae bacterium]|nr:heme A synthase [Microthrixaceae bacterium]
MTPRPPSPSNATDDTRTRPGDASLEGDPANGPSPRNERLTVSPRAYRRFTFAALVLLGIIVVTGAAVRLTGSGLGCEDWPRCSDTEVIGSLSGHQGVEQANRLFTGAVSVAVAAAVLGALRRRPYRPELTRWAWSLVAGVVAQIVWGGVTVLTDLHPAVVIGHFLISMVLVWAATVLHVRAGAADEAGGPQPSDPALAPRVGVAARAVGAALTLVLLTGPVVTGAGPHAGDADAPRFGFNITSVVRLHSATAWLLVGAVIWLAVEAARGRDRALIFRAQIIVILTLAQGALGYTQYALGVPPVLVAAHIAGVTVLVAAITRMALLSPAPSGGAGETAPGTATRLQPGSVEA